MNKALYFDMDGTIASLYDVEGWLEDLVNFDPRPYREAPVMLHMATFAKLLHKAQRNGYHIGIISWLSKSSNPTYDEAVVETKNLWLKKHLPSVIWDEIVIVPYGTPKSTVVRFPKGILFDDEQPNRTEWGNAYDPSMIMEVLRKLG